MKKFTDFIINKRYFILVLFIILTIVSGILATKVTINHDISKYLPDTSETRIGMNIMEKEFSETQTSTLNLMFENLPNEKKQEIKEELSKIDHIETVDYDDSENYNKENYTLYVITVDDISDSNTASNVYNQITEKYKDYTYYTSGNVSDANKNVLPIWIIVLAVVSALIILLIMCESYIEPFLFLTSILMAVVLNKGTNIIFPNVSHITNSITAILQMALSMDYSIMLMNRYNQEKKSENDKVKAMKSALFKAFQSISSSSITTIAGLLALVFMSFKIGKDLGFVLAKGVLFSLICIFFVLPSLILMFDKWIVKTKKRSPKINLTKLGKFSYKIRYIALPIFLVIFVTSFMLKGYLGIDYTETQSDQIANIFDENNQIAIIYKNEDEDKISKVLKELKNQDKVDEVLGYGNTINEPLTYNNLNNKLNELGSDVNIDDYLLKILYYDYYNYGKNETLTFSDFINFVENYAYKNEKISSYIDDETKSNITRLKNFTSTNSIDIKRNSADISNILGFDEGKVNDIFIYYLSKNNSTKISLNEFINFVNKDVLTNPSYSAKFDNDSRNQLNTLSKYTNNQTIQKKMTSTEMANLFGIDNNMMNELYKYYILINDIDLTMSISEFSNFVLNDVLNDSIYANSFDTTTISNIKMLSTFSNLDVINKQLNSKELSTLFDIEESKINQLLLLKYLNSKNATNDSALNAQVNTENLTSSPIEFVNLLLNNNLVDEATKQKLSLLSNIMTSTINNKKYTYYDLSQTIGIDANKLKSIYALYVSTKNTTSLTPQEFVNFVLSHKDDTTLEGKISTNTLKDLNLVQSIMNSVINNQKYEVSDLSNLLGINKDKLDLLYGLYTYKYINTNPSLSLKNFVEFLLNDVVNNPEYSNNFDNSKITKLQTINNIMNSTINNTAYTSDEFFTIISTLASDIDKNVVKLLYTYYGSINYFNDSWQLTVEEFVKFLNEKVLNDERFTNFIEDDMRNNIIEAKSTVSDAKNLLIGNNYSRIVINTKLAAESQETFAYIQKLKDMLGVEVQDFYIIGNSPMAYEMSQTFNSELDSITIITMIIIFIVVTITFKSGIIPTILVLIIQCAVYLTMGILSFVGENVYFISILIVQSILMGATIDYAILYTSYYLENRKTEGIKEAIIDSYNKSINTILTSSSILIIVTLIIANFASAIAAKICKTISEGTLCSTILILLLLPAILAFFDRFIVKFKKQK